MDKKLPAVIPLIKLRDNGVRPKRTFYFGNNQHDRLVIRGNAIHYYNLQNSTGTEFEDEGYTFLGEKAYDECAVERFDLEAYIGKYEAEIAALKAENERLKAQTASMRLDIEDCYERERKHFAERQEAVRAFDKQIAKIRETEALTVKPTYLCAHCAKELNIQPR